MLLSLGSVAHLSAQTTAVDEPANLTSASLPITVVPLRTYTGTAVQTSAAGVAITGTITISFSAGAKLNATTTIGGVTTIYSGELLASDAVLRVTGTGTYHTPKTVGAFNTSTVLNGPARTIVVATGQIPVIVNKAVAYGGLQNDDGSALTFRATRDAK